MKKVSIVIPCYNAENTIEETLLSVANQTYENIECIIVDDCSKDNSRTKISDFIKDKENFFLKVLKQNRGGAYARNIGVTAATGNYIMFLDSDDILDLDCLNHRLSHLDERLDFMVFPNYGRFKSRNHINKVLASKKILNGSRESHLHSFVIHDLPLPWNIMSVLWKQQTLKKLKGFDIDYVRLQDVELMVRALYYNFSYKIIDNVIDCYYRYYSNEEKAKKKRAKFFDASLLFIIKCFYFDKDNLLYQPLISSIRKFYAQLITIQILSNEFSQGRILDFIQINKQINIFNNHIKLRKVVKFLIQMRSFLRLPVIRTIIWRTMKVYIKL